MFQQKRIRRAVPPANNPRNSLKNISRSKNDHTPKITIPNAMTRKPNVRIRRNMYRKKGNADPFMGDVPYDAVR
jgi:hypothetical protein